MKDFIHRLATWIIPEVILLVVLGFLIVLVYLPLGTRPARTARMLKSTVQARSLVQASIVYSYNHDDRFPTAEEWPDALIELGIIEPELLISAVEDGDGVSFIYLPIPGKWSGGNFDNRIVIYEDPKHFENGVVVSFADARTEFVNHDDFERMLAEQFAAQDSIPETP